MPKPSHRNKILAYKCAKCFTTDALKLAWLVSKLDDDCPVVSMMGL